MLLQDLTDLFLQKQSIACFCVPARYHREVAEKGALKVYPYAEQLVFFTKDTVKPVRLEQRPMPGNFTLQMESFVDSILKDREPAVTGKDGMKALKIILAAYKSAEKQQLIKL